MNTNGKSDLDSLPLDMQLRSKLMLQHELQALELMRLEYMFQKDKNGLGFMRDWIGDQWIGMTQSLLERGFVEWGDRKRLVISTKSVRIIAAISNPIWKLKCLVASHLSSWFLVFSHGIRLYYTLIFTWKVNPYIGLQWEQFKSFEFLSDLLSQMTTLAIAMRPLHFL